MPGLLEVLSDEGEGSGTLDLGTVPPGGTSEPRRLRLRNQGDQTVYFARVRATLHPTAQVGPAAATARATEFAATRDGAYAPELELGTLAPGEERPFWVRWAVPPDAPPGAAAWAVEALGTHT